MGRSSCSSQRFMRSSATAGIGQLQQLLAARGSLPLKQHMCSQVASGVWLASAGLVTAVACCAQDQQCGPAVGRMLGRIDRHMSCGCSQRHYVVTNTQPTKLLAALLPCAFVLAGVDLSHSGEAGAPHSCSSAEHFPGRQALANLQAAVGC